jgi:YHS domain-containing protein
MKISSLIVALSIVAASALASAKAESRPALTPVKARNLVCMVNDMYMGKEQIPVEVSGKTYYGCCPMCKERLEKNPEARSAVDPVSGKKVDKATAVIGRAADDAVVYFETAANLAAYNKRQK